MDALLPEDVLAEVLGRLSPRSLAALRCVCKGLRDIVDDRRLLRADLLPHSLGGIFINFNALEVSEFFYPLVGPAANSGNLTSRVDDHCNGLVLLDDGCVVNPATRQWARLPPLPTLRANQMRAAFYKAGVRYLAFDPSVAPYYEVFLIPRIPNQTDLGPLSEKSEWPPSTFILYVYSSRTRHWEERPFVRQGDAGSTVAHHILQPRHGDKRYGSVYLRGALYVHCHNNFFYKISSSTDTYRVIKPPVGIMSSDCHPQVYLGKSDNEVHCALVDRPYKLRVWILDESGGQHEWALKHSVDLKHVMQLHDHLQQVDDPWFLEDTNYNDRSGGHYNDEGPEEEENRWSSVYVTFIGFHPFKDVVFLSDTSTGGMAYHFNSSRVQYLGKVHPRGYQEGYDIYTGIEKFIEGSFPFTPCWMGELSEKRLT